MYHIPYYYLLRIFYLRSAPWLVLYEGTARPISHDATPQRSRRRPRRWPRVRAASRDAAMPIPWGWTTRATTSRAEYVTWLSEHWRVITLLWHTLLIYMTFYWKYCLVFTCSIIVFTISNHALHQVGSNYLPEYMWYRNRPRAKDLVVELPIQLQKRLAILKIRFTEKFGWLRVRLLS